MGLRGAPGTLFSSGERDYGPPIDLWGAGCIMAEMWTRSPIMQGNTEQHQLALISQLCGSITPEVRQQTGPAFLGGKDQVPSGGGEGSFLERKLIGGGRRLAVQSYRWVVTTLKPLGFTGSLLL